MDSQTINVLLMLGFVVVTLLVFAIKEAQRRDPTNTAVIELEELPTHAVLESGAYEVVLTRQSGGIYKEVGVLQSKEEAISEVLKAMRRGQIDAISLQKNTPSELAIIRLHHSGRGRNEGRKLGGAHVMRALPHPRQ